MKVFTRKSNKTRIQKFYIQVIEDILASNPEALELLINLSILNPEVLTNIDRKSVETSYEIKDVNQVFNDLLNKGILEKEKNKEEIYHFSIPHMQTALETLANEKSHEKAIEYYKRKIQKFGPNLDDDIEILFHNVKINLTEELVNDYLGLVKNIEQNDIGNNRLITIAEELIKLESKYKAPILVVLGNLYSVIGKTNKAEKAYLNALETYKKLAKQYYRIYLPYIATTQKNLGTLYIDLKRFEEAEKIFLDALNVYKELEKNYYSVHSPELDFDNDNLVDQNYDIEHTYLNDIRNYNELLKKYYDVYLPNDTSSSNYFGNVCIDLDLLEDIQDGSIDSFDSYKKLAKMCYDMYLIDVATAQSNLGLIYSEEKKFEDAEKMHHEALKIRKKLIQQYPDQVLPDLAFTLIDLGDLYASQNKFEEAEKMYHEGLKISKQLAQQYPEVYSYNVAIIMNCLGSVYIKLEKIKDAEPIFLGALKIFKVFASKDPKAYSHDVINVQNNLGTVYMLLDNIERAEYYLNKAFKRYPENIEILYNKACLESLKNNSQVALELLNKVIKEDKNFIERILIDKRFDNIRKLQEYKELVS
ncbi:MAG: tetratricopeptide repeat protein [Candidatus Thorarchaeota archaeon]